MHSSEIGGLIGILGAVAAVLVVIALSVKAAERRDALEELLATGRRLTGVLEQVGPLPSVVVRQNQVAFLERRATFVFETPEGLERVETAVVVPEVVMYLFQAGARCEVRVDAKTPTRLCIVALYNSFGVAEPVTIAASRLS